MAVLAQDVGHVVVILRRHRRVRHLVVQVLPQLRHVHQRRLAYRARVVPRLEQLLEAGAVQQVAAVRYVARDARRVDVFQAYRAVGARHVLDTLKKITWGLDRYYEING